MSPYFVVIFKAPGHATEGRVFSSQMEAFMWMFESRGYPGVSSIYPASTLDEANALLAVKLNE
jgi:hypothetical protein